MGEGNLPRYSQHQLYVLAPSHKFGQCWKCGILQPARANISWKLQRFPEHREFFYLWFQNWVFLVRNRFCYSAKPLTNIYCSFEHVGGEKIILCVQFLLAARKHLVCQLEESLRPRVNLGEEGFRYLGADVALVPGVPLLAGALARPPVASLGQGADLGAEAWVALQAPPLSLTAVDRLVPLLSVRPQWLAPRLSICLVCPDGEEEANSSKDGGKEEEASNDKAGREEAPCQTHPLHLPSLLHGDKVLRGHVPRHHDVCPWSG